MRLQHVSITRQPQRDQQTRLFYGEVLGLPEVPVPRSLQHLNLIWFQLQDGAELHILIEADIDAQSNRHFCLIVEDLAALRTRLVEAGYAVWDVEDIPGRPRFFTRDPSNNMVELATIEGDYRELEQHDL